MELKEYKKKIANLSVNEQKCIIKGTYDAEIFGKLVSDDILGVSQNSFIINRSGDIIAGGKKDHELKDIFSNNIKYASILKNHITKINDKISFLTHA